MTNKRNNRRQASIDLDSYAKLAAARRTIAETAPYMLPLVHKLVTRILPNGDEVGLQTMGVDKNLRLYINEKFLAALTHEEVATVLLHEIQHPMLDHFKRAELMGLEGTDEKFDWNLAGDCAINGMLEDMGLTFPIWDSMHTAGIEIPEDKAPGDLVGVFARTFELDPGQTAEYYYREIRKQRKEGNLPQHQEIHVVMEGGCGEAAGNAGGYEEPTDGTKDANGVRIDPGRSDAETQQAKEQVAQAVREAAQKGQGNIPSYLQVWSEEMLKPPKIRWQNELQQRIARSVTWVAGRKTIRWSKYSRRQAGVGYGVGCPVIPKMESPLPRVAVIGDTSGSMGAEELTRVASETDGIMKAVRAEVTFMAADVEAQEPVKVRSAADIASALKGGGGTSFIPPLRYFEEQGKAGPDIVVYITDGGGDAPTLPPRGFEVIWVLVGSHRQRPYADSGGLASIEWGTFIEVDDDD